MARHKIQAVSIVAQLSRLSTEARRSRSVRYRRRKQSPRADGTRGNRHFANEGKSIVTIDTQTGLEAKPIVIDEVSGRPLTDPVFKSVLGPAASRSTRRRYAMVLNKTQESVA